MRRLLSGLLYALLGLPVALSALLALSVRPWALDQKFYDRAISDQRLWTALRSPEAAKKLPERVEIGGYVFSGPALGSAVQMNLPEAELKALAREAAGAMILSLESGETPRPLDLRPLKARLSSDSDAIAAAYLVALPEGRRPSDATTTDLATPPPNLPKPRFEKLTDGAVEAIVASMPDEARAEQTPAPRPGDLRVGSALDRFAAAGLAAAAALLLGLGFLGGGGTLRSLARAGKMLILPSSIVLVAGIAMSLPGAPIATPIIQQIAASTDPALFQSFRGWLGTWLGEAARSFFLVGLSGASIGGFLASLRRIVDAREI